MDPIQVGKIKPFKINSMLACFSLRSLFSYSMVAITCTLLCTCPLWIHSFKTFLLISLPNFLSIFLAPMSLFLLGNLIVFILVRGSKIHDNANSTSLVSSSLLLSPMALSFPFQTSYDEKEWEVACEDVSEDCEYMGWEAKEEKTTMVVDLVGQGLRKRADEFIAKLSRQILIEDHVEDL